MNNRTIIFALLFIATVAANAQFIFRISGNGLGLTQAKAIVEYYGGTIYAKSNTGNGMGIYIQLPTT